MEFTGAIVALGFVVVALVSRRLDRSPITTTMVFVAIGLALGPEVLDFADPESVFGQTGLASFLLITTLTIVLFTDASAINSARWSDDVIPARLLGIGLPLMVFIGWLVARQVLPGLETWEAALLATMLAPTDAALGKAVIANRRVPQRMRQALNVESGLNDGIALPLFVVFLEAARVAEDSLPVADLAAELGRQVGVAVIVGGGVGWLGARAVMWAQRRRTAEGYWLQIGVVALAIGAYALADPLGGSGFIAAWVAGFLFGHGYRRSDPDQPPIHEFGEAIGTWLTMSSFLLFGLFLGPILRELTWPVVVYAVLSLVVLRLVSVIVATLRGRLSWQSVAYIGWFGPRGLATVILSIEVLETDELAGADLVARTALFAVALSVVLHGATAWWWSNAYATFMQRRPDAGRMAEHDETPQVRAPRRFDHDMS